MRLLTLVLTAILGLPPYGPAQDMLRENPDRAGVTMHAYEFHPEHDTPAPKGYKPFYLFHYGRHGSRNETSDRYYKRLIGVLEQAQEGGFLSADGERLLGQARQMLKAYRSSPGHLTPRGEAEHRELARRIYNRYKPVFTKGGKHVRAESSIVPRCIVSMSSFTTQLTRMQPDLEFSLNADDTVYSYISHSSSKEHSEAAYKLVDSITKATAVDTVEIYRRLFLDPEKGKALVPDADHFQHDIWRTAKAARACDIDGNPYEFLTEDVIYKWWQNTLLSTYLRHCNSVEFSDLRRPRSIPLAKAMFDHADDALEKGDIAADLFFGHDFPLLGLVCWLRLEGVGKTLSLEEITREWYDPTNIPLASNMQMVLYRSKKKDAPILVKFVYNGRERAVEGLTPVSGPYYNWEDLAAFRP